MKLSRCCGTDYLSFTAVILIGTSSAYNWNYSYQDDWLGPCLTGRNQSPINLENSTAIPKYFYPFKFTGYNNIFLPPIPDYGYIVNLPEGFTAPKFSGGGLEGDYVLECIHLHWRSEHTINGERYPLEAHLMHYAEKYGNFINATRYPSGVAVFATLYHMCLDGDKYIEGLIKMTEYTGKTLLLNAIILEPGETHPYVVERNYRFSARITAAMFLPRDRSTYYRYEGSLTTPTCNEGVTWTVFTETLPISQRQVNRLPKMWRERKAVLSNNRDIQKRNHRKVYFRKSRRLMKNEFTSSALNLQPFNGYFVVLVALAVIKCTR